MRSWSAPQGPVPAEVCQPMVVHGYSVSCNSDCLGFLHLYECGSEYDTDRLLVQRPSHRYLVRELRSRQRPSKHLGVVLLRAEIHPQGKCHDVMNDCLASSGTEFFICNRCSPSGSSWPALAVSSTVFLTSSSTTRIRYSRPVDRSLLMTWLLSRSPYCLLSVFHGSAGGAQVTLCYRTLCGSNSTDINRTLSMTTTDATSSGKTFSL